MLRFVVLMITLLYLFVGSTHHHSIRLKPVIPLPEAFKRVRNIFAIYYHRAHARATAYALTVCGANMFVFYALHSRALAGDHFARARKLTLEALSL